MSVIRRQISKLYFIDPMENCAVIAKSEPIDVNSHARMFMTYVCIKVFKKLQNHLCF